MAPVCLALPNVIVAAIVVGERQMSRDTWRYYSEESVVGPIVGWIGLVMGFFVAPVSLMILIPSAIVAVVRRGQGADGTRYQTLWIWMSLMVSLVCYGTFLELVRRATLALESR